MLKNLTLDIFIFAALVVFLSSIGSAQPATRLTTSEQTNLAEKLAAEAAALDGSAEKAVRMSAISKYEQATKLFLEAGDKTRAAELYNIQGTMWMTLGNYPKRLESYENALKLYTALKDENGEALSSMNVGDTLASAGENERALTYLLRAFRKFREYGDQYLESVAAWTIGQIFSAIGQPEKALEFYLASQSRNPTADGLDTVARGNDYLGRYEQAFSFYDRSLKMRVAKNDTFGLSKTHSSLGSHFALQGKFDTALEHFKKALEFNAKLPRSHVQQYSAGVTQIEIGRAYVRQRETVSALRSFDDAKAIFRAIGDATGEAWSFQGMGEAYELSADHKKAQAAYLSELGIRRLLRDRQGEAIALYSLSIVCDLSGNPRLGIFFGKQAVNKFQELRGAIKGLERDAQTAFLKKVETSYKTLADLLVSQGRLPEAQAVLGMLKEEEIFQYVSRDAAEIDKLSQRTDLRDDEKTALAKYEELEGRVSAIGAEFAALQEAQSKLSPGESLPPKDQARFGLLTAQLENANTVFQVFLRELANEFAAKPRVVAEIQENTGLQADLKEWGAGVVALYTIVGDERYRIILTTSGAQVDGKTEITAIDLNKKIAEFRSAIQNPRTDPRPLGKELYDILVKPIEGQLAGAKARTLLWSLDGAIRYVPLAALWDGKQYFGQKYQNVVITIASRTRLSQEPVTDWRVLGLGVTLAKQVAEPNGSRIINFSALPSVRTELDSIIVDSAGDPGVVPGLSLFDDQFTEETLKARLTQRFKVVHIASHFSFRPGDMTKSFLLMGDGKPLTMDKIKTSPQLKFGGVELLALSACDTAVGEADANGREVESFAVIAQQNGAKAVMATLWPVADESTSLFMTEFYRLKKESAALSKAAAVQTAQKAMIDGRIRSSGGGTACRADEFAAEKKTPFKCDPNAPFSHPYFWSPFILIGNWR